MATEMKSTNTAMGDEAVKTSKMEMDTQSGKRKGRQKTDKMEKTEETAETEETEET